MGPRPSLAVMFAVFVQNLSQLNSDYVQTRPFYRVFSSIYSVKFRNLFLSPGGQSDFSRVESDVRTEQDVGTDAHMHRRSDCAALKREQMRAAGSGRRRWWPAAGSACTRPRPAEPPIRGGRPQDGGG